MSYIIKLRQKVGKMPLIMVGSTVIIRNDKGEVLLQKRADSGLWSTIGGAMEPGETFAETARREVMEECGIELGEMKVAAFLSGSRMNHEYPNGDKVFVVTCVFEVFDWQGTPKVNDEESLSFRFFDLAKPLADLDPLARRILIDSGIKK